MVDEGRPMEDMWFLEKHFLEFLFVLVQLTCDISAEAWHFCYVVSLLLIVFAIPTLLNCIAGISMKCCLSTGVSPDPVQLSCGSGQTGAWTPGDHRGENAALHWRVGLPLILRNARKWLWFHMTPLSNLSWDSLGGINKGAQILGEIRCCSRRRYSWSCGWLE